MGLMGTDGCANGLHNGGCWLCFAAVKWNWSTYLVEFAEAAEAAGFVAQILAETQTGNLMAWEKPGMGRCVYLSSGIHGDEPAGPLAMLVLLKSGAFGGDGHWMLCPALNPTGLAAGNRENGEGQDLNRDYRAQEHEETRAHVAWLENRRVPDLFLSLHEDWESTGFYFYEINCGEDQPERARAILNAVAPWFPPEPSAQVDGHEVREQGWIDHIPEADLPESWPEAIYVAKRGCPLSFTFETPSGAELAARVSAHVAAVQQALRFSCSRSNG